IGQPLDDAGPGGAVGLGDTYYLLWSVERVGVAYDLTTIGGNDWYRWGSAILLAAQRADGGWQGKFGTDIDTSFALLFLRRANLSRDLTAHLKGQAPVEVALKSAPVPDRDSGEKGKEQAAKAADEKAAKAQPDNTTKTGSDSVAGAPRDNAAKPRPPLSA